MNYCQCVLHGMEGFFVWTLNPEIATCDQPARFQVKDCNQQVWVCAEHYDQYVLLRGEKCR